MSGAIGHVERCATGLGLPSDSFESLARFSELLARHGRRANLVGTTDISRIVDEIVVDSARLSALIVAESGRLVDIGAGAGIPIIPLLLVLPGWAGVAVEPRQKRREFMVAARRTLGLADRLSVLEGRLGENGQVSGQLDPEERFDLAVTKAVFSPSEWAIRARALIHEDGRIGVYASRDAGLPDGAQTLEYTTESGSERLIGVL